MKLAFKIAWRFLSSNKGQTILITLGIAIGVSVQVFIGSLISGLQKDLINTTIGSSSQITVKALNREDRISDYESVIAKITNSGEGFTEISPSADASAFIKNGEDTFPVLMRGFDLEAANGIYKFKDALIDGSLPSDNEVILGKELMEEANLSVGDKINILTPLGKTKEVTISGIYDLKVSNLNRSWVVSKLDLVQDIFD